MNKVLVYFSWLNVSMNKMHADIEKSMEINVACQHRASCIQAGFLTFLFVTSLAYQHLI